MASDARVCPFCGEPPGDGMFCAACGRNLGAVERLPTREEWSVGRGDDPVAAFLEAMRAAGYPGTATFPMPGAKARFFSRTPEVTAWVVRPVAWDDLDQPRRHEPGLVLTTDGTFHVLESQVRGWGQRNFPQFYETAEAEPVEVPADSRLATELDALLHEHGVLRSPSDDSSRRGR
jgi:hypothetical protein